MFRPAKTVPFTLPMIWQASLLVALLNAGLTKAFLSDFYIATPVLKLVFSTWAILGLLLTMVQLFNRLTRMVDPFFFFFNAIILCALISLFASAAVARFPLWFDYDTIDEYGFWSSVATTFTLHYTKGLVMISTVTATLIASRRLGWWR